MKKVTFLAIAVIAAVVAMPAFAGASEFIGQETVTIAEEKTDDCYVGTSELTVSSKVDGDLTVGVGVIAIEEGSEVTKDLTVGAGQGTIYANVGDDTRVGAGQIVMKGDYGDDVMIGAGTIDFDGNVGGGLYIGGGNVIVGGEIAGDLKVGGQSVQIKEGTKVNGDLVVYAENDVSLDGVTVMGEKKVEKTDVDENFNFMGTEQTRSAKMLMWTLWTAGLIIVMLVITALAPLKSRDVVTTIQKSPWKSLGFGLLWLIVTPIVAAILLFTIVGTPIALITLVLYAISLYLTGGFLGLCVGMWLMKLFRKKDDFKAGHIILSVIVGVIAWKLILLIPYIGPVIGFIGILFMAGAMLLVARSTTMKKRDYPMASTNSNSK